MLLKAMHVKPWDQLLTFNLALVRKRLAVTVLQDETSSFLSVCDAIADLNMARCTFDHLSKSNEVLNQALAADEARTCQDLLSQAKYHLDRAKSREEQERVIRKKQEDEREAQRKRQLELQKQAEQMRLERERRLEEERGRFLEKAKQIVLEPVVEDRKGRKSASGGSRRRDDFIASEEDDSSDSPVDRGDQVEGDAGSQPKSKQKKHGTKRRSTESRLAAGARKKQRPGSSKDDGLTAKQRMRVVSKAIISESSDSTSDDDFNPENEDARVAALAKKILSSDEEDLDQPAEEIRRSNKTSPSSSDLSDSHRHLKKAHKRSRDERVRSGRSRGQKRHNFSSEEEEEQEDRPRRTQADDSSDEEAPHVRRPSFKPHKHKKRTRQPSESPTLSPVSRNHESDEDNEDSDEGLAGLQKRKRMVASSDSDDADAPNTKPTRTNLQSDDEAISQDASAPADDLSSALSEDDSS